VTEEREGLLASEPTSDAVPVVTTKWTVRREVVDAWKRLGDMLRWENILRLRTHSATLPHGSSFPMVYNPFLR